MNYALQVKISKLNKKHDLKRPFKCSVDETYFYLCQTVTSNDTCFGPIHNCNISAFVQIESALKPYTAVSRF